MRIFSAFYFTSNRQTLVTHKWGVVNCVTRSPPRPALTDVLQQTRRRMWDWEAIDQERKTIKKLLFPSAKVFGTTELVVQLMVYIALWFCSHTLLGS